MKAQLFKNGQPSGNMFSQDYKHHLAIGATIELNAPSEHYNTGGAQTLINGIVGTLPWSGNEWLGWRGEAIEAGIDLGVVEEVHSITLSFLQAKESWIHLPEKIFLRLGNGNTEWQEVKNLKWGEDFAVEIPVNQYAQVVAIKAVPKRKIPKENPGSGNKPWLFCSEIIVE